MHRLLKYPAIILLHLGIVLTLSSFQLDNKVVQNLQLLKDTTYTTIKSNLEFKIDGLANEPQWEVVKWASNFTKKGKNVEKDFATKFKILYDDNHIYVAIKCLDPRPDSIPMYPSPRDNNSNDWVEIDFDTNIDKKTAYAFVVSPYGVRTDMYISGDDEDFDDRYHPKWEVKTKLTNEGWFAEMKIPFDQMRIPNKTIQHWGLQITRHISRINEYSNWKSMPKGTSGWVSQFGQLHGLSGISGKVETKESYNPTKKFSPYELKKDFNLLTTVLEEIHPSLYWFSSKKQTDSLYQSIEKSLDKELTEFEFYDKMVPVFNLLGDGHGWIRPSSDYVRNLYQTTKTLPIGVKIVHDQIFVTKEFCGDKNIQKGMKIKSINGIQSKDIISQLCYFVSSDGQNQTWKIDQVSNNFSYYLSYILGSQDDFILDVITLNGEKSTLQIQGLLDEEWKKNTLPKNLKNYRQNNWDYHILNKNTAYLSIYTFARGSRFRIYMDEIFTQIKKDGIENLVIDIRDNGGGNDSNGMYLYSYLSKKPFRYFEKYETKNPQSTDFIQQIDCCISEEEVDFINAESSLDKNGVQCLTNFEKSGFQNPIEYIDAKSNAFKGELYLLVNGGSFSVSSDFASQVYNDKRGIIIGEETGGGYFGNTSGIDKTINLPNTGLRARINFIKFTTHRKPELGIKGRGVIPHYAVNPNQKDISQGVDTELEFILDLIENKNRVTSNVNNH